MSASVQLLLLALCLYTFSLGVAFFPRFALKKYRGKAFAIPYDRLPIAIALVLLLVTAGADASGNEKMANDIAIMAYYLLVLGVVLQIINYIREQRERHPGVGIKENRDRNNGYIDEEGKDSGDRDKDEDYPAKEE